MTDKMRHEDLAKALHTPSLEFRLVKGCCLLVKRYEIPDEPAVEKALRCFNGDIRRTEEALNGFYVVSDFFDEIELNDYSEADLSYVAREYKFLLDEKLKSSFPGVGFAIEIVGESLLDEEPLELHVTFSRCV